MTNTVQTYRISSRSTGLVFGDYPGALVSDALDAYARDAGYRDFEGLCDALGMTEDAATDDLRVVEVP
jgi:hypothetical protein